MDRGGPEIAGPEVLIPGSDFLLAGAGRLLLVVGFLAALVAGLVRFRRTRRGGPHGPPWVVGGAAVVALLGAVLTVVYWPPSFFVPEFPPLPRLLPAEAFFYSDVTDLPVHPDSDEMIVSQGSIPWSSGFRGSVNEGIAWGNPFNLVDDSTQRRSVEITLYPRGSYPGPYPINEPPYIEGFPTYHFDQHYLALDLDEGEAWELLAARRWFGRWQADSGARWRMDSLDYPEGSTIAAGLPMLPGTITYDAVRSGSIDHVLLGASPITAAGEHVWPARGTDGTSSDPDAPPMGTWLRLRADADLSRLGPQATVIARAAQRHGVLLSDTGPGFGLRGTPDARWDDRDLDTLGHLSTDDFEVVDASPLMVDSDSMAARR